ncbi:uncharacterized protein LOC110714592 [Chenopodium quinoa]|uniref:uncharacterized protein LOC110714592 n=1 Tax=Chenopodium quinoa TaxID=63459 RepID=UPI000B782BDB|nr:uncharacterized protein LOC110714592 [Chenopodium quinoa]XP_021748827.1 uncharacterized protein LOC110714592 [Chenopodium quinoa]XP_021748828.1 uncharacterized protein LOC110714592 [Chenopodium quinoa]
MRRTIGGIPTSVASLSRRRALGLALAPKFIQLVCCSSLAPENSRKLILYSKPGCCLCDGLKEKLSAAFSLSSPTDPLHDVDLQIRDITTNPEWERAYQYEIPVLAKLLPDGTEVTLPRLSPRLGVEVIQRKIGEAFRH